MSQLRLFVSTTKPEAENDYQKLEIAFEDDGYPVAINEIDEKNALYELSLYVPESDHNKARERMAKQINRHTDDVEVETLPDIDWVTHSLKGLKPIRAGGFFVHGHHDRDKIKNNKLAIEIEAGQAFGTGHHATTTGCLEMIHHIVHQQKPSHALDLGTGSGVLAIAMAKLQPMSVIASDIDPIATKVAADNILLNGVERFVQTITATGFDHTKISDKAPYPLIVANILAQPLVQMAATMTRHLANQGSLVLSGILANQREKVLNAYLEQGLQHQETMYREDWVTLHLKKSG